MTAQPWWTWWSVDPLLVLPLLAWAWLHARGRQRLRRHTGRAVVGGGRTAGYGAALAVVALALVSPLERASELLLSAHMVQHLLLLVVAPPLLVAAAPSLPTTAGLPGGLRGGPRGAAGTVGRTLARAADRLHPVALVAAAWAAHLLVTLGWHAPALYEAALADRAVHALEHVTMLTSAWVLWWLVLRRGPRAQRGAAPRRSWGLAAVAFGATGVAGGLLGALLTFAPAPWYATYARTAPSLGVGALTDQQVAGLVMWVPGGGAYLLAATIVFARWLRALDAAASPPRAAASVLLPGALLSLVLLAGGCRTTVQAGPSIDGQVERGRTLLVDYGCVSCHAVPGIAAPMGQVGPPLGGIAERRAIAGRLPNTPGDLVRWIMDPQDVSPGNLMPDLAVSEHDATDIAAYLYSLRQGPAGREGTR